MEPWVERPSRPAAKIPLKMSVLGPITPAFSVKLKPPVASANARLQNAADPFCFSSLFEPCFFHACVARNCAFLARFIPGCFDQDSPVIKRIRLILCADLIGLPIAPPTPQTPVSHLARSPSTNAKIIHQTLLVASSPLFSFSNSLVLILGPSPLSSCACVSAPVLSVIPHHAVRHNPCSNSSPPLRLRRSILPSHLLRFFNLLARWLDQLSDTWP
ncbi:hypothetical protein BJX62DRAFT_95845 [Aspergillus germanicus]